MSALKREHRRCADIPDRKATPMLPEPTIPKRRAAAPAPQPWVMTPLFGVPDEDEPVPVPGRGRGRPARSFLRYGVPGDPETAVHAAMNVVEPVLQARDIEILRLRRLMPAKRV